MITSNAVPRSAVKSVLVVDDHAIVRIGVLAKLGCCDAVEVVGEARDGLEALEMVEALRPDIVVTDLSMPSLGGLDLIHELKRQQSPAEVVVFSVHRGELIVQEAIEAGARAYVCKEDGGHLIPALQAVSRGQRYLSPSVDAPLARHSGDELWDRGSLTCRERQIVRLVALGHSNKDISRLLQISVKTTETHRAAAMRKTGTNSVSALTIYAARNGLVEL